MLKRTITAVIGVALLVVACIYSHTIAFPILIGLMTLLGVYEMLGCVGMRKNFIVLVFCGTRQDTPFILTVKRTEK